MELRVRGAVGQNDVYANCLTFVHFPLRWRHNELAGASNHQPHDCLFNRLFTLGSKKTSKLYVTGLYAGNSPVTSVFPAKKPVTQKCFHLMTSSCANCLRFVFCQMVPLESTPRPPINGNAQSGLPQHFGYMKASVHYSNSAADNYSTCYRVVHF